PSQSIPFSAFWLRSSVVSVLISLISDMWAIVTKTVASYWGARASPRRCTTAWAWRTPPSHSLNFCRHCECVMDGTVPDLLEMMLSSNMLFGGANIYSKF
ncbi:hypothetical protein CISIN_1g038654mg, partial [Citrus sinensis]